MAGSGQSGMEAAVAARVHVAAPSSSTAGTRKQGCVAPTCMIVGCRKMCPCARAPLSTPTAPAPPFITPTLLVWYLCTHSAPRLAPH
eukprot:12272488-Prorocentrum_lima.AAC.1